jgi:hypothetical protein
MELPGLTTDSSRWSADQVINAKALHFSFAWRANSRPDAR